MAEYEVAYPDPGLEFKRLGIEAPDDFVGLYREIICCKDSNHEGKTTRFLPIEEIAGFTEDLKNGFFPFYDYLNFCWILYVKAIPGLPSKIYCEFDATEGRVLKMEFANSIDTFLKKIVAHEDVFGEVNALISKKYPRIKL